MPMQVNLDAMIPREDFEVEAIGTQGNQIGSIQIRDLENGAFFYPVIRKPDFQRETTDWTPDRVVDLLLSFLSGDLIPALILWQSGQTIFVIDGAHRLSVLIAWVRNDYGDGELSKLFFDGVAPEDQLDVAEKTRQIVKRKIGSYEEHKFAAQHPERSKPELIKRARALASLALQLQWVKGDARKAEASFFKINQQAAPIEKTEIALLKSRNKPNALAARAIVQAGTGHKYWKRFNDDVQNNIETLASEIHRNLFKPNLKTPIKTLDLPVAGRGYSAQTLPLVFDFVNIVNQSKDSTLTDDIDGQETINFLKNCRRVARRISGTHASSLGLHPVIYFYSDSGRYQPTAFLAIAGMVNDMEKSDRFKSFALHRAKIEDFLIKFKVLTKQIVYKNGSGMKGYTPLKQFYEFVLLKVSAGLDENAILTEMITMPKLSYLQPADITDVGKGRDFNSDTKSAVFLKEALANPLTCALCGGAVHANSITVDHIQRREDGGLGALNNGQLAHPYCNSTLKN